jgi:integrase
LFSSSLETFVSGVKSVMSNVSELKQKTRSQYHDVKQDLEEIKKAVVKTPKPKGPRKPLREPATKEVLDYLLSMERNPQEKRLCHARFRVAITLLWYTRLRINEIRPFTLQDIATLAANSELQVYQPKMNKYKRVYASPTCIETLSALSPDIDRVFKDHETLSGNLHPLSWIRFINRRIAKYTDGVFDNVRSHSFRVNYTTSLLKHAPLQEVANIIGHQDIKTTLRYNRYSSNTEQKMKWITWAL